MITLITGGPGMGKTALAVKILITQYADRPIFTNIRGLTLEHSKLPKIEEWTTEVQNDQGTTEHQFTFPPGSVIVIDECQQFFRPRASGSRVPPYITAFETHRHQGIDFVLITQGSRLVDSNLRALVKGGLHIFLKSSYLGRYRYEKSEVINEDEKSSYSVASRRKYKLPSDVFHLYKSAEVHTKPPRAKLPFAALVIVAAVGVGGSLAYRAQQNISAKINPDEVAHQVKPEEMTTAAAAQPQTSVVRSSGVPERIIEALALTDEHNHLSAPLFAPFAPPVVAPQITGCIASKRSCACYSQQITPVWMPEDQCRQRAAGTYYDPYQQPTQREQVRVETSSRKSATEAGEG